MASVIDIANIALSHVGGNRITSLNGPTEEAAQCQLHYGFARDKVLGEREWTFAIARRQLAKVSDAPAFGPPSQFQLPSDCIRVLRCYEDGDYQYPLENNTTNWYKEGDKVVTDRQAIYCQYIRRVEDPNLYTAGFIEAVATYLAHKICIPLTANRGLSTELLQIHEEELTRAAVTDGLQGKHRVIRYSRLTSARRR
tara:strand:- start:5071 stop:5661 length:591 start_codon:yes stop_codon:yes gene_type:complete